MPGKLYIVGTPIGNLADISLRALSTLKEVDLIAAEDTRVTRKLLSHYGITTQMTPYHQHSLGKKAEQLLAVLREGKNVAVVSDAGMPGISDPGHELITFALREDIPLEVIPGANAVILALVASGLPTYRFTFDGFPPRKPTDRRSFFRELENEPRTMVFYESPLRLLGTLKDMRTVWGDRQIAVAREITKLFEEIHRGTISSAIERFEEVKPRGEITIVVMGTETPAEPVCCEDDIEASLRKLIAEGMSERDAVKEVTALFHVPKKEIYRRMLALKAESAEKK